MEAHSDGAGFGEVKSLTAIIRDHNAAVLGKIGQERHEHLSDAKRSLQIWLKAYGAGRVIAGCEEMEQAQSLMTQIDKDLSECTYEPQPEEDNDI